MAEHTPRPMAMDPPHITEFASERYWEKLAQLKAQQLRQNQNLPATENLDASSSSTFILPLRDSRNGDVEILKPSSKREKGRFSSIRQKLPLLHSKSSQAESSIDTSFLEYQFQSRLSIESARRRYALPLDTYHQDDVLTCL